MHLPVWTRLTSWVLATVGIGAGIYAVSSPAPLPAPARAASAAAPRNVLSLSQDSEQLAMIRSEPVAASPVSLAEALSARVTYDDNVTARIGVGVSGRVLSLKANTGDRVRAGQVLALLDSPDLGSALSDVDKARADEERKRLALERVQSLGAGDGIAAKDVEAAQADYAMARAETVRAQQRVRNLNPSGAPIREQRLALVSPIDGIVTERNATPALEVTPGAAAPLFVVSDLRRVWVMVDVPESLLGKLHVGAAVRIESDAYPGQSLEGRIARLGELVDPSTRRVQARVEIANTVPGARLLPEMFVRAWIEQGAGQGFRLPNAAIVQRGLYPFVFVETAPGRFERRQVSVLARGSEYSFVGTGLRAGERVVTSGALLLDAELAGSAS